MDNMSQKDGVFSAIGKVIKIISGQKVTLTPEQRKTIITNVIGMFESGSLTRKSEAEEIGSYVSGLVSNHLRKDKRLNGDIEYKAANPGSRAGSGSPVVKELRKLLKSKAGTSDEGRVQSALDTAIAEHKASKGTKSNPIDFSFIPDELSDLKEA